jgi:hypothetical protein
MTHAMDGAAILHAIARALGLPDAIALLQMRIGLDEPVTVLTRTPLVEGQPEGATQEVQAYHLHTAEGIGPLMGMDLGRAIHEAFQLPPETNLIQIRIATGEVVEVLLRFFPGPAAMARCQEVLAPLTTVPAGPPGRVDDLREPLEPGAAHSSERPGTPVRSRRD